MKFNKEYWEVGKNLHVAVFTESYVSSFAHVKKLVTEAKKDYPDLADDKIRVVVYRGDRRKSIMGIEFEVKKVSTNYSLVNHPQPIA